MRCYRIVLMVACWLLRCQHVQPGYTKLWWLENQPDELHIDRFAALLRAIVSRGEERFADLTRLKTELEKISNDQRRSFEKGYVMGDVIETYRKATVQTHKQLKKQKKRYPEADRIRYLTFVQDAFMKVFHLVHMLHEINPKFGTDNSGQIAAENLNYQMTGHSPTFYYTAGFNHTAQLQAIHKQRREEAQKKRKREQRIREDEVAVFGKMPSPASVKRTTNWWPVLYGWDMDYYQT